MQNYLFHPCPTMPFIEYILLINKQREELLVTCVISLVKQNTIWITKAELYG